MNIARFVPGFLRRIVSIIVLQSYVFGLAASAVLGGGYYIFAHSGDQTQAATSSLAQVERQTIISSVKSTGEVTFANEQELRFNQKGKVTHVYFKEGDRVTKGQLIAQLDTSSVAADIRQAQLSLNASALQLQQLNGDKEKSILDAENALRESERQFNEAQNSLAVAKEKLPTDIAGAERALKEKEAALAQAEAALAQARVTTLQDLASTAQSILAESEDLLDTLYGVLVNEASARRTTSDTSLEIYHRLYVDYGLKNETERSYYTALQAVQEMRATYGSTLPNLREADVLAAATEDARETARILHALADTMYRLVQGATDDPNVFTINDINAAKQAIMSARSSAASLMTEAETAQASLMGGKDGLTSITIQQKEDALKVAQNALLDAQENLSILKTQTPGDLAQQEAALTKIQDDYKSKQLALGNTTKNSDVTYKLKQNDIAQKSTSLQKTAKTIEDYQLTAPFDGVIRRLDYQIGDNLLDTGEEKFMVLENPDFLVVTILLDQVDIVRVRKDMPARITLDALPGQEFQGTIYEINSTPIQESGVVSYEVAIRLPTPKDLTILSGMTSTVEIETTRKENVLVVPNLALQRTNERVTVTRADGQSVPVEVGATDGRVTEILSGLQEGDSILSMNITTTQATQGSAAANPTQLLRMGAGGGGGGGTRNFQR
jgi:RND family efflux transporter MFP subunit